MKLVIMLLTLMFCSSVFSEDRFEKIDPNCDVWVARRGMSEPEFVILMKVREPGHPDEVWPYFPDMADKEDISDKDRLRLIARIGTINDWTPIKPVPRFDDEKLAEPTQPGYYWCNEIFDLEIAEDPERSKLTQTKDVIKHTRKLVLVIKKKDGSLGAMQFGRTFVFPLKEFGRWSRGLSVKSIIETKPLK